MSRVASTSGHPNAVEHPEEPIGDDAYMSDSTEYKAFTSPAPVHRPSPHQELSQMSPADIAFLLRIRSAMNNLDSSHPEVPPTSTSNPTSTQPASAPSAYTPPNPHSAPGPDPAIQLKLNSLSPIMREKFLVPNLNLRTSRTTVPNIAEMVMLFSPHARPAGRGYIRKDLWIQAYLENVKPLLEPFIFSIRMIEVDETDGYAGYTWEYYKSREFDPSAHWITTEVLADLLHHFCPHRPIPPRRSARERMFRQTVWGDEHEEDPPPAYSLCLPACNAPHHLQLGVDHLRFTLQQHEPSLLIPTQTSKPVLCKLYELYVHHRVRNANDPIEGTDFFWVTIPSSSPVSASSS